MTSTPQTTRTIRTADPVPTTRRRALLAWVDLHTLWATAAQRQDWMTR